MKKYYEAYDKRYKQVHEKNLSWEKDINTPIIEEILTKYNINKKSPILEIGCGEGRDAKYLLNKDYNIQATDISKEAIKYCKEHDNLHKDNYQVLDVLNSNDYNKKYNFIYSIACIHMLVLDIDRINYYKFIYDHLEDNGIALILSMGDGKKESKSNIEDSFKDTTRTHLETKKELTIATTSCRIVNFKTLTKEVTDNNFTILEKGITSIIPSFPKIMYIVIKK